jgi:hypothetical protein
MSIRSAFRFLLLVLFLSSDVDARATFCVFFFAGGEDVIASANGRSVGTDPRDATSSRSGSSSHNRGSDLTAVHCYPAKALVAHLSRANADPQI